MTLFLWRPVMSELVSALPISGAPYTFLLNTSTKTTALVAAALLLLDFAATAVVSAATAASYLWGEVRIPFPEFVGTTIILVLFIAISLTGVRESAKFALCVLILHVITMVVLLFTSFVHWGQVGNTQLRVNWNSAQAPTASSVARQIFNGFCVGVLGLTGFECTPSYTARIKAGQFPRVLRNLHYPAIALNCLMMLVVLALVPLDVVLSGANILSVLATNASGRWLRLWVVVDAVIVLSGGVLTGILSAGELFERLARDRVIPQTFLNQLPVTRAPYNSAMAFVVCCAILYATAAGSLAVVSKMFSLVWLCVMALFPLSLISLKFNRGRLPRALDVNIWIIVLALVVVAVVLGGNVAIDPPTAGYFAVYTIALILLFSATQNKIRVLRWCFWLFDQNVFMHSSTLTRSWGALLTGWMKKLKKQAIGLLVKSDEIGYLTQMILYVRKNEETCCIKIVHFYDSEEGVPSELEANSKILDEAFPEITLDLILVQGQFTPTSVRAVARQLDIPPSLMFMSCPSIQMKHNIADIGARIIAL